MSKKRQKAGSNNNQQKGFALKTIIPKTPNQKEAVLCYNEGYNLVLHGVAGTGKTFLSMWLALKEVFSGKYKKIIILRSAVPSRTTGFLPGNQEEKTAIYEAPYKAICSELFERGDAYEILKAKHALEFGSTSYLRGITINNAIVIVDEIQNYTFEELDTVITRTGNDCRIIFCGDLDQSDLYRSKYDQSGLSEFLDILELCRSFAFVEFDENDIVRGGIVKEWIKAKIKFYEEIGKED